MKGFSESDGVLHGTLVEAASSFPPSIQSSKGSTFGLSMTVAGVGRGAGCSTASASIFSSGDNAAPEACSAHWSAFQTPDKRVQTIDVDDT